MCVPLYPRLKMEKVLKARRQQGMMGNLKTLTLTTYTGWRRLSGIL
jgi:hypothetical protein